MNDFKIDLQYSLESRDNDVFDNFYRRVFPGISVIEFCNDLKTQKTGVDKIIHFKSGNKFTVDEKKRRKNYNDIALEIWSDFDKKKKGWLCYSVCDYIVYAIMPSLKVYVLPTILLKRAWYVNKTEWLSKYPLIFAPNKGYRTQNICIPPDILLPAIADQMEQKFVNTS